MVVELNFVYIIHRRGLYRKIKIDDTFLSMSYYQQYGVISVSFNYFYLYVVV